MQEARHILKKYWGHDSFRPLQPEIISAAVDQKNIIALLPTGGGKSICFQIPGLLLEGITIVVSPLVALMEDQVKSLTAKGIKALAITGGISYQQLDVMLDNCIYGNYKFLYLSPERIQQDLVQQRIKQMNVNLIAIDEAHCISQWGHDFRPSYLEISILRELHPEAPLIALTASATREVVKDIQDLLRLRNPEIFKSSLQRKNLAFHVLFAEDKTYRLTGILKNKEESAIIYVRTRKATTEIVKELQHYQYSAIDFHGGLSSKEKKLRLNKWLSEEFKVIVATSAFGMGIDKPNVRNVIHLHLPESVESYFQEAGRAGRDEKSASATIITNNSDLPLLRNQFIKTLPDLEFTLLVYKKLVNFFQVAFGEGKDLSFDFNFADFCSHYKLHPIKTYNTLQLLDRISIIRLSQQFQKVASIKFLTTSHQLFDYLRENPHLDSVVKAILRTYGGIMENKLPINMITISEKAGAKEAEIIEILKKLHKDKVAEFDYRQNDASITFLVPREDENTLYPFSKYIKEQARNKTQKVDSLLEYVKNGEICRSKQLLNYFGEVKVENCGICDVCLRKIKPAGKEDVRRIYKEIIGQLETGQKNSRELVKEISFKEEEILNVLQLLIEKDIVVLTANNCYKIKHL